VVWDFSAIGVEIMHEFPSETLRHLAMGRITTELLTTIYAEQRGRCAFTAMRFTTDGPCAPALHFLHRDSWFALGNVKLVCQWVMEGCAKFSREELYQLFDELDKAREHRLIVRTQPSDGSPICALFSSCVEELRRKFWTCQLSINLSFQRTDSQWILSVVDKHDEAVYAVGWVNQTKVKLIGKELNLCYDLSDPDSIDQIMQRLSTTVWTELVRT
jgi:hypothetical protein